MIFDTLIQTGDWKGEKHVPVITAPESFSKDEGLNYFILKMGKNLLLNMLSITNLKK